MPADEISNSTQDNGFGPFGSPKEIACSRALTRAGYMVGPLDLGILL